eukprot:EG_transcript_3210
MADPSLLARVILVCDAPAVRCALAAGGFHLVVRSAVEDGDGEFESAEGMLEWARRAMAGQCRALRAAEPELFLPPCGAVAGVPFSDGDEFCVLLVLVLEGCLVQEEERTMVSNILVMDGASGFVVERQAAASAQEAIQLLDSFSGWEEVAGPDPRAVVDVVCSALAAMPALQPPPSTLRLECCGATRSTEATPQFDCLAATCGLCAAPFTYAKRRIWCPVCGCTICPQCCASPLAAHPRTRPRFLCRPCARQRPAPADQPASSQPSQRLDLSAPQPPSPRPAGNRCPGCGSPFTLLRTRRACGQCAVPICTKCEVRPPGDRQGVGRCAGCAYGPAYQRRRVGVDRGVPGCLLCGHKFALFNRRHWCRRCGRTICRACSSTPLSVTSRRNPNCICKLCQSPHIFRLSYDLAQYVMEFCDWFTRGRVIGVCKGFLELLVLPYTTVNQITDWYELVDAEDAVLGIGAFGAVHRARCRHTGEVRAVKVIPKHRIASYAAVQLVMREIDVHAHIDHPNSVRLYQVLQSQTDLFLVMGYAGEHNLADVLTAGPGVLPEDAAGAFVHQLLHFLVYLHEMFILHRDLKPQNIVLSLSDEAVRVVDFGLAKVIQPPTSTTLWPDDGLQAGAACEPLVPCTPCGTLRYCAPEVLVPRAHLRKVSRAMAFKRDIFSVGALAYTMLTGQSLYHSTTGADLLGEMRSAAALHALQWMSLPSEAVDFIQTMCSFEPRWRPTAAEALCHPWLQRWASPPPPPAMPSEPPSGSASQPAEVVEPAKENCGDDDEPRPSCQSPAEAV